MRRLNLKSATWSTWRELEKLEKLEIQLMSGRAVLSEAVVSRRR
jgi:hypothetical protein